MNEMDELVNQYADETSPPHPAGGDPGHAEARLRALIAEGEYKPGERLPPERDLKDRFGISRAAIRRALEGLEREGLIWRHVGKGTFVSARSAASAASTDLPRLARHVSPYQMMRARLSLEPAISREAAINATEARILAIETARDRTVNAETWDAYEAADDMFHRAIAEATENPVLLALFDQLNQVRRAVAWNTVVRKSERPQRDHSSFAEHERITAAIRDRNATEAHAAMRAHLASVSARLFDENE